MTTHHRYLDRHPVNPSARAIIIGTIHPHDYTGFAMDFFYGSQCSTWTILAEAFPDRFPNPITREAVLDFLTTHRITMSDTIRSCDRISNTALDTHLIPRAFNLQLVDQLRNSQIEHVFFTSGAGKNGALRTFYTGILRYKYLPITVSLSKTGLLPTDIFGRDIAYTVLYSPATTADRGIMKTKAFKEVRHLYQHYDSPVHAYKVALYRQAFSFLVEG
ncbi:hypothetical protein DCC81_03935 [Chitinophaga parva]|uniref:DNA glycosylase n=1 Tax=Chitinophaga parva TaxID=2169414 RepID=A0A2T7BLT3_9BACT|nr:hypothetical protein [Chitinophaga parva]PUZ28643.1 hypothetical protein DCC81_03935 [Chitinophaga parva]